MPTAREAGAAGRGAYLRRMRTRSALACLVAVAVACARGDGGAHDSVAANDSGKTAATRATAVAPGTPALPDTLWLLPRAGGSALIAGATSEADLIRRFGAANVKRDSINTVESEMIAGTVLFPDDSTRRLEIVWDDSTMYTRPGWARAWGTGNRWTVAPGVRVGTPMAEVERLNGKPFTFSGFSWDYGGNVHAWEGGQLEALWSAGPARVSPTFDLPDDVTLPEAEANRIMGDREVRSDNPIVRKAGAIVRSITVSWEAPAKK
jgi:hypothetical protein